MEGYTTQKTRVKISKTGIYCYQEHNCTKEDNVLRSAKTIKEQQLQHTPRSLTVTTIDATLQPNFLKDVQNALGRIKRQSHQQCTNLFE